MPFSVKGYTLDDSETPIVKWLVGTFEPNSTFRPHSHYRLEISMILSGEGEYWVNGCTYPMKTGDIVLFNNDELHCMRNSGSQSLVNGALEFDPRFIWTNPSYSFHQDFLSVFFNRNDNFQNKLDRKNMAFPGIQQKFLQIQEEFMHPQPHGEAIVKARLLGILADLLRYYDLSKPLTLKHDLHSADMDQVLMYIAEHFNEDISLTTLADILHINKTYFSQVFRESNGLPPKEYIVKVRIAAAARQLTSTDKGVLDIAQSCGFNSLSNFYSAFKRVTGKTPTQYRDNPLD